MERSRQIVVTVQDEGHELRQPSDGFMNAWAARFWWMLRTYGFDDAAVLNGGWHKWKKEGP
jgi:3-mercaptopyruvate sulfurtransferase SseA